MSEWTHDTHAQVLAKLTELVGAPCIVKFDTGEMRGIVEEIAGPVVAEGIEHSIDLSKFKVRLESGDGVIVLGSALSRIDTQAVAS